MRCSQASTWSRPTVSIAQELEPGKRKCTPGDSIRSNGRTSPRLSAARLRVTILRASQDRNIGPSGARLIALARVRTAPSCRQGPEGAAMAGTRQRIIGATAVLMRRQGYEATGMKEIVAAASAPFGSVYHFFPGGKEQLGAETIRWSGAEYAKLLAAALDSSPDLAGGVRAFFDGAAEHLVATGYADACPIATIALEVSSHSEVLRQACAEVFEMWIDAGGVPRGLSRRLAIEMLALLEGAFVLCRAVRDTEALAVAAGAALASLAAVLAPA